MVTITIASSLQQATCTGFQYVIIKLQALKALNFITEQTLLVLHNRVI
jgi:hypothetical protein